MPKVQQMTSINLDDCYVKKTNANSVMVWQIIDRKTGWPVGQQTTCAVDGPMKGLSTVGNLGWKTKREAAAVLQELKLNAAIIQKSAVQN